MTLLPDNLLDADLLTIWNDIAIPVTYTRKLAGNFDPDTGNQSASEQDYSVSGIFQDVSKQVAFLGDWEGCATLLHLQAVDLLFDPQPGDTVTVGNDAWTVKAVSKSGCSRKWLCGLVRVAV